MLDCAGLPLPTITAGGGQSAAGSPAGAPPIGRPASHLGRQAADDSDTALDDDSMYSCFNRWATIAAVGGGSGAPGGGSGAPGGSMYPLSSFYASLSQSRFPPTAPAPAAAYSPEQLLRVRPPHLVYPLASRPPGVGGVPADDGSDRPDTEHRATERLADRCRPVLKFSVNAILGDNRDDREEQTKKGERHGDTK